MFLFSFLIYILSQKKTSIFFRIFKNANCFLFLPFFVSFFPEIENGKNYHQRVLFLFNLF